MKYHHVVLSSSPRFRKVLGTKLRNYRSSVPVEDPGFLLTYLAETEHRLSSTEPALDLTRVLNGLLYDEVVSPWQFFRGSSPLLVAACKLELLGLVSVERSDQRLLNGCNPGSGDGYLYIDLTYRVRRSERCSDAMLEAMVKQVVDSTPARPLEFNSEALRYWPPMTAQQGRALLAELALRDITAPHRVLNEVTTANHNLVNRRLSWNPSFVLEPLFTRLGLRQEVTPAPQAAWATKKVSKVPPKADPAPVSQETASPGSPKESPKASPKMPVCLIIEESQALALERRINEALAQGYRIDRHYVRYVQAPPMSFTPWTGTGAGPTLTPGGSLAPVTEGVTQHTVDLTQLHVGGPLANPGGTVGGYVAPESAGIPPRGLPPQVFDTPCQWISITAVVMLRG